MLLAGNGHLVYLVHEQVEWEHHQGLAILRLESRDRDWYRLISSLVVKTETETMTP